jgi:predicted porin
LATRIEAGLTASETFNAGVAVTPYVRGALGEKFVSGSSSFTYYSVEPGVAAALGNGVSASLGWRFQDAVDNNKNDQTRTWRAKLGYDIAKNSTVYIGYDIQRGDSDQNIAKIGFVQRF